MTSKNTTNFEFLKDFRPELYRLAVKMEADLLITPVSMLAYSTRFLEYILYDFAKLNDYEVDKKIGFVENIYELTKMNLDMDFADLLIKTYVYRNNSIHNTNITKALNDDKKIAFELNRRLFDVADIYYALLTGRLEKHSYIEPHIMKKDKEKFTTLKKQEKIFDTCIICGQSNRISKSNFCPDCDNLMSYRDTLAGIISKKGKNAILSRDDFNHPFKSQMIGDLLERKIIEQVGNNYSFVNDNLDNYFKLIDKFIEIDEFLADFHNGVAGDYRNSGLYASNEYPCLQVSRLIDDYHIWQVVRLLENGFSLEHCLSDVDVNRQILDNWYEDKKSAFIDGLKDDLFIRYNEILIKDLFKSIEENNLCSVDEDRVDFWCGYFEGFSKNLSNRLAKQKLIRFIDLFKDGHTKQQALDEVGIDRDEFDSLINIHKILADEYLEETDKRKELLLTYVEDLSLNESIAKSKLDIDIVNESRTDFLNGNKNEFYRRLAEILQKRYLNLRNQGLGTHEACEKLTIDEAEVKNWFGNKSFMIKYQNVRLDIFKNDIASEKSKNAILSDLEIGENELNEYISLGKSGNKVYFEYYDYFENRYYKDKFSIFLNEFRQKHNINLALKEAGLTRDEFNEFLKSDDNHNEFEDLQMNMISNYIIKKGKINEKFLKKIGMTKKEYNTIKTSVNQLVCEKQLESITESVIEGLDVYTAAQKVNCDWRDVFEWIYKGALGEDAYEELADEYFSSILKHLNEGNDKLRKGDPIFALKKNIKLKNRGEYEFEYWVKWGLIDKNNHGLTVDEIKTIMMKNEGT